MSSSPPLKAFPPTTPDLPLKNSFRSSRRSLSTGPQDYRRRQGSDATAYVDSYLNNFMVSRVHNEGLKMTADTEDPGTYRSWQPFVRRGSSVCGGEGADGHIEKLNKI